MSLRSTNEIQRARHASGVKKAANKSFANLLMVMFAVYFLFPIIWLLLSATKSTSELYSLGIFQPGTALVDNAKWLTTYNNGIFGRWFLNSVLISLLAAGLSVLVSSMGGYALTKYNFFLRKSFSEISFATMMIPQAATVIPIFLMLKNLNMINSYWGVILPMIASPFGLYFMTTYLKDAIPDELLDAGRVDGANDYRIFFSISLPIMVPGLITLFLITFTSAWNNFFLPLVLLNKEDKYPITVGLKILVSNLRAIGVGEPLYPLVIMGSIVSILPMLFLFTTLHSYITSGITMGSVKS